MALAKFKTDVKRSSIHWVGKKITGVHTGTIDISNGSIDVDNNKIIGGSFDIDTTSIIVTDIEDTETNSKFAEHLFSDDFFDVNKFPNANFTIVNATQTYGSQYKIDGLLTIRGITHSLSFDAAIDLQKNSITVAGAIVVDRTKYGIKYGSGNFFKNLGDTLIFNDFTLNLNLTASLN